MKYDIDEKKLLNSFTNDELFIELFKRIQTFKPITIFSIFICSSSIDHLKNCIDLTLYFPSGKYENLGYYLNQLEKIKKLKLYGEFPICEIIKLSFLDKLESFYYKTFEECEKIILLLSKFKNLKELSIGIAHLNKYSDIVLSKISNFESLTKLSLNILDFDPICFKNLIKLKNLKYLKIITRKWIDCNFLPISIEELNLDFNNNFYEFPFLGLKRLQNLKKLKLKHCLNCESDIKNDNHIANQLVQLTHLKELTIKDISYSTALFLSKNTNIEKLIICNNIYSEKVTNFSGTRDYGIQKKLKKFKNIYSYTKNIFDNISDECNIILFGCKFIKNDDIEILKRFKSITIDNDCAINLNLINLKNNKNIIDKFKNHFINKEKIQLKRILSECIYEISN